VACDAAEVGDPDPGTTWLSTSRMLLRGVARRCPLCGEADTFASWFSMRDRCPRCNLSFDRVEGHWIGALGMNTVVSFGALLAVLVGGVVLSWPDPPGTGVLVATVATAVVVPLAFFPSSRTLWSAIDLAMRPLEPADDVDPRYLRAPRRPPRPGS
jgi:uncharacterized protein (DUF983 family)